MSMPRVCFAGDRVLSLHHEGLSLSQIAFRLGIEAEVVESRLARDLKIEGLRGEPASRHQAEMVVSKRQNHRLWQSGAYGNRLRSWRSIDEWRTSGYDGLVVLRTLLGTGDSGPCLYDVLSWNVENGLDLLASRGIPPDAITIDEAAPKCRAILQGEYRNDVCTGPEGEPWWGLLHYSRARGLHMRDALARCSEEASGLRASLLLRYHMSPASHDDWQKLVDRYPGHVLEVSIYDGELGDLPGRNSLVWEIRRY